MTKIKTLVLLAAISVVASNPLKTNMESPRKVYQKLMMESASADGTNFDGVNFRLPNNTMPTHYNIRITTNIHEGNLQFTGMTRIFIRVLEATNTITMHSMGTLIQRVLLLRPDLSTIQIDLTFRLDTETQFFVVNTRQQLQPNQEVVLQIDHTSFLRTDGLGFYRTIYQRPEPSERTFVASTLFEPTHARNVFPCYDEIGYRTTFDISIVHGSAYHALSNMPVAQTEVDGALTTTTFETTPAMPTYNVAFTVFNFESVGNDDEKLPMRVFALPEDIAAGRADRALELSGKMWKALEEIFEIPYPLPKSDIVAIRNFRNGESWGLLKIDDWVVLSIEGLDDPRWKRSEIAHEFSVSLAKRVLVRRLMVLWFQHTYFSNLVSPTEWSFLW
jgi:aminopeptidase N